MIFGGPFRHKHQILPGTLRLVLDVQNNSGVRELSITVVLPRVRGVAFTQGHVLVEGSALRANGKNDDGAYEEIGNVDLIGNTFPDSLTVMIIENMDTAWFRIPVPFLSVPLPVEISKKNMKSFISMIQNHLIGDEADLSIASPAEDLSGKLTAESLTRIKKHSTKVRWSGIAHGGVLPGFPVAASHVVPGKYIVNLVMVGNTNALKPILSTVQANRLPDFEYVPLTTESQRVMITK